MNNTALLCPLYLCQAVRTETPSLGDPSCQWQSWRVKSWRTQGLLPPPSGWGTWRKRECELAAAAGFMTSCCLSIMVLWWRVLSPLPHKMTPRKVPPLPCPVQTTEQLPTSYLGSVFVWTSQAVPGPVSSNCISYCEGSRKNCPQFKTAWPQLYHPPFFQYCLWCYFMLPCWRSCPCWLS